MKKLIHRSLTSSLIFSSLCTVGFAAPVNRSSANENANCKYCPPPDYPPNAPKDQPDEATVLLTVTVTTDGHAEDVVIEKTPGDTFSEQAVKAIKQWRFRPARDKDGKAVPRAYLLK